MKTSTHVKMSSNFSLSVPEPRLKWRVEQEWEWVISIDSVRSEGRRETHRNIPKIQWNLSTTRLTHKRAARRREGSFSRFRWPPRWVIISLDKGQRGFLARCCFHPIYFTRRRWLCPCFSCVQLCDAMREPIEWGKRRRREWGAIRDRRRKRTNIFFFDWFPKLCWDSEIELNCDLLGHIHSRSRLHTPGDDGDCLARLALASVLWKREKNGFFFALVIEFFRSPLLQTRKTTLNGSSVFFFWHFALNFVIFFFLLLLWLFFSVALNSTLLCALVRRKAQKKSNWKLFRLGERCVRAQKWVLTNWSPWRFSISKQHTFMAGRRSALHSIDDDDDVERHDSQ